MGIQWVESSEDERNGEEKQEQSLAQQKANTICPAHGDANVFQCDALSIELTARGYRDEPTARQRRR